MFSAVEAGATVLTGSNRLARSLTERYTAFQRDKGRSVWKTPSILSWDGFLQRCWDRWLLESGDACPVLLNPSQELAVWESIVAESPQGRSLLRVPETAAAASTAWTLVNSYRLPFLRSEFGGSPDCEAFFAWASSFVDRCKQSGWMYSARLSDAVAKLIRDGRMERPFPLILAGIDDQTPQQSDLLDALCGADQWPRQHFSGRAAKLGLPDTTEEIRRAANWARRCLECHPDAKIGIVVPNVRRVRLKLDRLFREHLGDPAAFHISLGVPLSEHPIVHAALQILDVDPFQMLRSPFLKGAEGERSVRALLDAKLRRKDRSPSKLAPIFSRASAALEREVRKLPPEQTASQWSRAFARLWKVMGWPGDATPDSREYQTIQAFQSLLSTFESLDAVTGRMTLVGARTRLRRLASAVEFEPENRGAPVQIQGLLEVSGLEFDHLWVIGLHDEAMPPPARPNPFLPIPLQRQFHLPHSSADRELEFNAALLDRLASSSPDVVLSYPQKEGDQSLSASPLLAGYPALEVPAQVGPVWSDVIRASSRLEIFEDAVAPPMELGTHQSGGTRVLKDMAACPFRAFAIHRLKAHELEDPEPWMNGKERGSAVHKALQQIWDALQSQERLRSLDEAAIAQVIRDGVETALSDTFEVGRVLEGRRLVRLLTEWLESEKVRPPFRILALESAATVKIGGLEVSARIDRVDELEDGSIGILDYKTSVVKSGAWTGDRPEEPQIPLYAISESRTLAAVAFAQIRAGAMEFRGVSDSGALGSMKDMREEKGVQIIELLHQWNAVLNALASDFRNGVARVHPKQRSTCEYCPLPALCRKHDGWTIYE